MPRSSSLSSKAAPKDSDKMENQLSPDMLRDIKGPVSAGFSEWVLFVLLLTFLLAVLWFRKKKKAALSISVPQIPPKPCGEAALEKLLLARQNFNQFGDFKVFYSELSYLFREYLSGNYSLDAVEKTTSEIFNEMRKIGIERKICLEVRDILANCDLVKFAKFIPPKRQAEEDFEKTKVFIEKTKIKVDVAVTP